MSSKKSKARHDISSSDSDSGPSDPNPPKKSKAEKKTASGSQDDESGTMFQLSKTRYVSVREFRGKILIDIREYYDAGGDLKPGKKGICLTVDQWAALKEHVDSVDEAIKQL